MPVSDVVSWVLLGLELAGSVTQIGLITWFFTGGWKFILRVFGFNLDLMIVSFIARFYDYFLQIVENNMFNDKVLSSLLQNVYVFIGVIMFFRLMMLLIKYLINPDLVSDAKIGANALIQRVIIGLCGILFIPTLFDFALKLQAGILEDNLIQKIIIPSEMLDTMDDTLNNGGGYIGTYVLAGFVSPSETATSAAKKAYENGLENGDLSTIENWLDLDGWLGTSFSFDYFYILSTFCLCYVLYMMVRYCLDAATRYFRLLIYQVISPVAMIEYMINGSDDGVFKSWRTAIISTYCMLFVRVLALWFVIFVMSLMRTDSSNDYVVGSLLANDDYLLRGIIIIALIGFMMDLPKIIGQLFGLDLEQEGSATGILKQVGGMLKTAGMGALSFGGAAVGGAVGAGKAIGSAALAKKGVQDRNWVKDKDGKGHWELATDDKGNPVQSNARDLLSKIRHQNDANHPDMHNVNKAFGAAAGGMFGAMMQSNNFTGAAYKGYQGQKQEQEKAAKEASDDSSYLENKRKEKIREENEENENRSRKENEYGSDANISQRDISAIAGAIAASGSMHSEGTGSPIKASGTGEATIDLSDVKINVSGKAEANYNGGLETNITGKAVTNYNGDVETTVTGKATGTYNGELETNVSGKAVANIDNIETNVSGNAVANIDNIETNVSGKAVANIKDVETNVSGTAKAEIKDVDTTVTGTAKAEIKDVDTTVTGIAKAEVNDVDTTVSGGSVKMQDVDITRTGGRDEDNRH